MPLAFDPMGNPIYTSMGSIGSDGMPVTQPLSSAQPLGYGQSGPSAYPSTPATTTPQRTPIPLPPPRPPLSLAPPNPIPGASMPPPASMPSSPYGGLGAFAGGIGNMFGNAIANHPLTLMALGAGIAQGGVGRGLAAASGAAETERSLQLQQLNYLHTYNALTGAGVPPQQAQAAMGNPSLMRAVALRYLVPRAQGYAPAGGAVSARPSGAPARAPAPAPSPAAPTLAGGVAGSAAASSTPGNAPALPPSVPVGSHFSPFRNKWRTPDGRLLDADGRALQ